MSGEKPSQGPGRQAGSSVAPRPRSRGLGGRELGSRPHVENTRFPTCSDQSYCPPAHRGSDPAGQAPRGPGYRGGRRLKRQGPGSRPTAWSSRSAPSEGLGRRPATSTGGPRCVPRGHSIVDASLADAEITTGGNPHPRGHMTARTRRGTSVTSHGVALPMDAPSWGALQDDMS